MNKSLSILVVESSDLIFEGLSAVLAKSCLNYQVIQLQGIQDLERQLIASDIQVVVINPSFLVNNLKFFLQLKNQFPEIKWLALLYAFFDPALISQFDGCIHITDPSEGIIQQFRKTMVVDQSQDPVFSGEALSDRETEVLQLLATGLSNKEIADKLNISINTVITHRKNITQKTSIKSVSGLTIYAVVKKLISLDHVQL